MRLSPCKVFLLAVHLYITGLSVIVVSILCVLFPIEVDASAVRPPSVGAAAPDFTVASLDDNSVSLSDFRGRAVLINFWATWCGNCKIEMPWLAYLREKYKSQGFEVLGIVSDDVPRAKITALSQKYGIHYPILACNHATAQAYGGLPDLPESFFIDRHGKIVAEITGADSEREIEANIRRTLGSR